MAFSKKAVADNLRAERVRRRMTQADLAAESGISLASIVAYENEQCVMGLEAAWALADVFDMPMDELFGRACA